MSDKLQFVVTPSRKVGKVGQTEVIGHLDLQPL